MNWVRIHTMLQNFPAGDTPPVFDISADEDGSAVVEFAWDPQALSAPSASYPDRLRYYSTGAPLHATARGAGGRPDVVVDLPAQSIQLSGGAARWQMPQALWNAYREEQQKARMSPPASSFSQSLYYRVRVMPPGGTTAQIWPNDAVLTASGAAAAPHMGLLPATAASIPQPFPDREAADLAGGIPVLAPHLWRSLLEHLWDGLPATDAERLSLVAIVNHEVYRALPPADRANMLVLWLLAGPTARTKLPRLLDRRATTGNGSSVPIVQKQSLREPKTLVAELLLLNDITPHPDLIGVFSKEHLFDDVLTEILDPNGQDNQGQAGTCVPTSIQTMLIEVNPAEYVRLVRGFLTATARQGAAQAGINLTVPRGIFQASRYTSFTPTHGGGAGVPQNLVAMSYQVRTNSELGFQTALLRHAQGGRFPADDGTEAAARKIFEACVDAGLTYLEVSVALKAVFGVDFQTSSTAKIDPPRQQSIFTEFTSKFTTVPEGVLCLFWGPLADEGLHAVMPVRHEGGRVFFKNPQYPGSAPPSWVATGGNATQPPRHYDAARECLESVSDTDLRSWISGYFIPASPLA